ncbi:EpsG family protein [Pseudomonas monteilii]|uniref:EpsG family protein n=1 Tax=Pseudomonas monteilii TaxID=76759 RepID=UPI0018A4454F|nr:EpsG family protein [Pseudomonas monteilii]BBV98509.1 hypothetical protein STW0522PSE72_38600 [Pseudomonas monteilii]
MVYAIAFVFMALMAVTDFFSKSRSLKALLAMYFALLCVSFALLAGLRAPTVDPDYMNYLSWLQRLSDDPGLVISEPKDPGFQILYVALDALGLNVEVFFALVALLSLGFKAYYARQVFDGRFAMLVFFMVFARFYIVHDFIQIRVGVAIAIASCALLLTFEQRRWVALALYMVAVSFHAAVLAMLPAFLLFFVIRVNVPRYWQLMALLAAFLVLGLLPLAAQQLSVFARIAPYLSGEYKTTSISLLSVYFLVRMSFVLFLIVVVYHLLSDFERFLVFMSTLGLSFQIAFSWNDALGLRLAEVFGFYDMAMLCLLLREGLK